MSTTPPSQGLPTHTQQTQPKKKNTLKTVLIVLGVLGLLGLLVCGGCFVCVSMGVNNAFTEMSESVRTKYAKHRDVMEHIGENAEVTHDLWQSAKESEKGTQVLVFPIKGSKGSGVIIAKQRGRSTEGGVLRTSNGKEYPLE